jgi:hypothetical protein
VGEARAMVLWGKKSNYCRNCIKIKH